MDLLPAVASTFALAFFYFIGAIPAGAALNLPLPIAAFTAWVSYVAGTVVVAVAGVRLRRWLVRRLKISTEPDPSKLFWRVWNRFGLVGLAALAPITIGSQTATVLGLALGVPPLRLLAALALGAAFWSAIITIVIALGLRVAG